MTARDVLFDVAICALSFGAALSVPAAAATIPRYDHIFVIIEENHTAGEIIGNPDAPVLNRLAQTYGYASNFYAERHPSEPNYIALVGGNTFGIHDDDAFYCRPRMNASGCSNAGHDGYVDHTISTKNLATQLEAHGLSWKGYFESIPEPGSLAWRWPSADKPVAGRPEGLYAAKHNGFVSFRSVQQDPMRAAKLVGFDALYRDVATGNLPNYAQIVPNQCNDMHGLYGSNVPDDCTAGAGLVVRGDRTVGEIVGKIMSSKIWTDTGNSVIVITFDENDGSSDGGPEGCCGSGPADPDNPGGGHIPTIVITNHGPRHLTDPTPYDHYSLLRTTETAFGIRDYLGRAADAAKGVKDMTPLFATR